LKKHVEIIELVVGAMPEYATSGSAGLDLMAQIDKPTEIWPGAVQLIPSGIKVNMVDTDMCGILLPRSGLGHKHGVVLGNGTGVIDSDYQGEIMMSIYNRSQDLLTIDPKQRIAQLIFMPVIQPLFFLVQEFKETARGEGGFGSTGK